MKSKADNPKTRDRQAGNRYFIDNAFLKTWGAKLGPHCIAVYNVLVMHANADSQTAFPSFQTIGDMTGMSRRQAVREIDKLKTNNIIRVEERTAIAPDTGKSYFLSNIFTLLHPDEWVKIDQSLCEPSDTQSLGVVPDSHQPSDTQSPPLVTQSHPNNTNLNKTQLTTKEGESPPFGPLTQAIARICKIKIRYLRPDTGKELVRIGALLDVDGITPAQVLEFDQWRKAHHWSGKKGNDPPSLKQVGEFWGQYEDWVKRDRPDPPTQPQNGANHGTHQRSNQRRTNPPIIPSEAEQDRLRRMAAAIAAPDDP